MEQAWASEFANNTEWLKKKVADFKAASIPTPGATPVTPTAQVSQTSTTPEEPQANDQDANMGDPPSNKRETENQKNEEDNDTAKKARSTATIEKAIEEAKAKQLAQEAGISTAC